MSTWIHRRSRLRSPGHAFINKQRQQSLYLLIFGVVRVIAWIILGLFVGLGLMHIQDFTWARILAESVPFVVLISIYANAATDLDQVTAAFAALVASDASHGTETTRKLLAADFAGLEADITTLAQFHPGPEADALAREMRRKLAAAGQRPATTREDPSHDG